MYFFCFNILMQWGTYVWELQKVQFILSNFNICQNGTNTGQETPIFVDVILILTQQFNFVWKYYKPSSQYTSIIIKFATIYLLLCGVFMTLSTAHTVQVGVLWTLNLKEVTGNYHGLFEIQPPALAVWD
jgi:hypothetical protein